MALWIRAAMASCVLVASALLSFGAESAPASHSDRPRHVADSLEVWVGSGDDVRLTLRDPLAHTAFCGMDSTFSEIPGCRAFSMVEIYDEMGEDGVEASDADTALTEADAKDSLGAGGVSESLELSGTRRFVVLSPQVGDWTLDASVPASAGYLAATLWLNVRIAANDRASHVVSVKWAELKPGGRVRSKLRVGKDGSVELIGTEKRGEYVWPAKGQ